MDILHEAAARDSIDAMQSRNDPDLQRLIQAQLAPSGGRVRPRR